MDNTRRIDKAKGKKKKKIVMAIYEYKCETGGHLYKEERPMSAPQSLKTCPKCGSEMLRVYDSPAVQFKGSGFYKTSK